MSFFGDTTALPAKKKSLGSINADDLNSSQLGVPVTYFAGRRYIAGQFLSPGYNEEIKTIQGNSKGEQGPVGHVYFCDFGILWAICGRQPVEAIFKVVIDSEIEWKNDAGLFRGAAEFEDITIGRRGQMRFYWGSLTQPIDALVFTTRGVTPINPNFNFRDKSTWPADNSAGVEDPLAGHYDRHSGYRAQCYSVHKKWKLGRDRGAIPNLQIEAQRSVAWFAASGLDRNATGLNADARGVNPVGCLYEALTDPYFGRAYPDVKLLMSSFESVATALGSNFRIAPRLTNDDDFKTFVAQVLEHFDGWIRNKAGQLELGYFGHGAINVGALPVLVDDDLNGEPELKPSTYKDPITTLWIEYSDRLHNYILHPGKKYDNPGMKRIVGQPSIKRISREWITDPDIAQRIVNEEGKMRSLPTQSGEIAIKREWLDSHAAMQGDRVILDSITHNLAIVLRINKIRRQKDSSGEALLTVENERSIWPALYIPPIVDSLGDFHIGSVPIITARVLELPKALRSDPSQIQVAILARKPAAELAGFNVFASDDGSSYDQIGTSAHFTVYGTLDPQEQYPATTADLDVTTGILINLFGPGIETIISQSDQARDDDTLLLFVDLEIISVGQIVALGGGLYRMFGRRARYGTTKADHSLLLSRCFLIYRSDILPMSNSAFYGGNTVAFKLQPYTGLDELDISLATAINYTFGGLLSIEAPGLSPPSQSFSSSLQIFLQDLIGRGDRLIRYTTDGTDVTPTSREWPSFLNIYVSGVTITQTTVLKVRAYAPDLSAQSPQTTAVFTLVAGGSTGAPTCGSIAFQFSGTKGRGAGNLTMGCATPSSTIHYSKNGAGFVTYSTPIAIALGDTVDAYATAAGFADSPVRTFDNSYTGGGGGAGSGGGIHPIQ